MKKPIKIGLVGIGRAGWGMHAEELKSRTDKFQFVAACDIIEERRDKMKDRYNCKIYERIEDLICDPDVELVSIATRSNDHFNHATMALKAGKDVLLEKPMCETYEQAKKLKELGSREGGPRLYVRHNRRFEENFMKIQKIIASKILGDVYEIHISRNSFNRRTDWQTIKEFGGGQLLNWGPHIIDQSLQFLQSPVKSLFGDLKHVVAAGDCEDHLTISFLGENGRTIHMQISGGVARKCPDYIVYGTKGYLELLGNTMQMKYIDPDQVLPDPVADPGTPGQTFGSAGTFQSAEEIHWIEKTEEWKQENPTVIWDYLYDSIRNGIPFPISLEEAVKVLWVISEVKKDTKFEKQI